MFEIYLALSDDRTEASVQLPSMGGPQKMSADELSELIRHLTQLRTAVGSHLGLRISNFASKKPSNVRISTKNILTFDGLASPLELRAERFRIGVRTLFAPVGSSHPEQR